jgi:dipeptidyl aminopeptidase/acylaminoacyl peptidase
MKPLRFALVIAVAACFSALPAAAATRFAIDDLVKVVRVTDPQISPDGKSIVAVVSRPNLKTDKYEPELVLVDIATHAQRVLTHDRVVAGFPRWSPSGDRIAYIALDSDKTAQIYILPMNGGDSFQLTHAAGAVSQLAWKPDGSAIAFAALDELPKREGEAKFLDAFEVGANDSLVDGPSPSSHLWLIPAAGGDAKRLTSGSWSLPVIFPPGPPASPINWSPDGKTIAFVKAVSPLSGDAEHTQIELLDVATEQFHPLNDRTLLAAYPLISPDGRHVAYWYNIDGKGWNENEIRSSSIDGSGDKSESMPGIDRNMCRALWTADGKSLLMGANDGTTVGLWLKPLNGEAKRIDVGSITVRSAFWVDMDLGPNDALAFTGSAPDRAAELYYMPTLTGAPVRLTDFNASLDSLERGRQETVTWTNDGFTLDGVVTYPPDFNSSRKYPLVLYVHGGPNSASIESLNPFVQVFAAQGWIVFEPNYRGSDNLGNKFMSSIYKDAGAGPGRDTMAGVEMLEKRGFVDTTRVAVSGWSYGGYMTTWLLGHYNVWKAAVAGAAVTDWTTMYAISDGNVTVSDQTGGSPFVPGNQQLYADQSPITFAANIHAPTLILSDTGDTRVPIANSYELFRTLKDRGVTTRFFAYPIPGHSPNDPIRARDVRRRWLEWLVEYLGTTAPAATTPAAAPAAAK